MLTERVEVKPRRPTERQEAVLVAIHSSIVVRGFPPTIRELGKLLDIASTNGVSDHLTALCKKGLIERGPDRVNRSLTMTDRGLRYVRAMLPPAVVASREVVDIPVYESVHPDFIEKSDRVVRMSRSLAEDGADLYGYSVFGEMIDRKNTGFVDGDVLIVDPERADEGRLVLFLDEECEAVDLRKLLWDHNRWELRAVLNDWKPIFVEESELLSTMILGSVVALWRTAG